MRTVLLASLRHHRRRYVASALAVVIGVGFIVATDGLAGALRTGMTADVGLPYAGAEHVVTSLTDEETDELLALAATSGVSATPLVSGWTQARTSDGLRVEASLGAVSLDDDLRWQRVVEGRAPTAAGELLADETFAAREQLSIGDSVTFTGQNGPLELEIVGVAKTSVGASRDLQLVWPDVLEMPDVGATGLLWDGSTDAVTGVAPEAYVETTAQHVAQLQADITQGVDVIAMLVSVFAAIALGVAILVITNTFAILFAQRMRDFALLRCVGVTPRQLRRSVRFEALALGLVASFVGVLSGVALAYVLAALIGMRYDVFGTAEFRPLWLVGAAVVGIVVTLAAAWFPTRAVTKVSPLAAMRPLGATSGRTRVGWGRIVLGAVVALLGTGVLTLAVTHDDATQALLVMFAGGGLAFAGVLVLGPVLVPAVLTLLGRAVTRRGAAGAVPRLATSNAVRNPRRTATTTASLMVGVTLTTAVIAGLGTMTDALETDMAASYPLDQAVVATDSEALPDDVLAAIAAAEGVDEAVPMRGAVVTLDGVEVPILGLGDGAQVLRTDAALAPGTLVLPYSLAAEFTGSMTERILDRKPLKVRTQGHEVVVRGAFGSEYGSAALTDDATLEQLAPDAAMLGVWVRAVDGTDAGDLQTALARATAGTDVEIAGRYADRTWVSSQLTVVTAAVLGLLGVAVLIAVIGIANTLGLSVLERTRENSLLRAMGLTRQQLRRTLAVEGALLAAVAALLGVAIGLAFAWVGVEVMLGDLVESTFRVPVVQMLLVVALAVVAGVVSSVVPSHRAARVTPAAGLSVD